MSDGRFFTRRERDALWAVAAGRCENCGMPLPKHWHADHIHPHSKGGPTELINGAALCPTCNHKKGNTIMAERDPRSIWQDKAAELFHTAKGHPDFLVTACPGSGKTKLAVRLARDLLDAGIIRQVIVVAPTRRVRDQWISAAVEYGIDLESDIDGSEEAHGAAVTYSRMANAAERLHVLTHRTSTLLIADEIHHAADHPKAKWGEALQLAFEYAVRRLLLSGTPFRTDGTRIPFITYDGNGMAIPGYSISYGTAVTRSITRPIRFEVMDGTGEWMRGATRFAATARTVTEKERSGLLRSLYDPQGKWIGSMLQAAHDELLRQREEKPNAGGLVVASGIAEAKAYARAMSARLGRPVPVVHDNNELDNGAVIDAFRDGTDPWIVAVNMISEGVDIPRLTTLVFASDTLTEMWFRQVVGRITRQDGDLITASMFIPAVPELVALAGRVEDESETGLRDAEAELRNRAEDEQREFDFDIVVPLASTDAMRTQVIERGTEFTDEELRRVEGLLRQTGGGIANAHPAEAARLLRNAGLGAPVAQAHVETPPTEVTKRQLRFNLRQQIASKVGRLCYDTGQKHSHVHKTLNDACGERSIEQATIETLTKRLEMLDRWQG